MDCEKEVIAWHKETFPNATTEAICNKVYEETNEFIREYQNSTFSPEYYDELADLIITHIAYIYRISNGNNTLSNIVMEKLDIIKKRVYGEETPNGDRTKLYGK